MRSPIPSLLLTLALAGTGTAAQEAPPVSNARLETASAAAGLDAALRRAASGSRDPHWVAWAVPMIPGQRTICCFNSDKDSKNWKRTTCQLEGRNQSWGGIGEEKVLADQKLLVLLRFEEGKPVQMRSFSATCPLDAGGRRFVWLTGAQPEASVAYLSGLARTPGAKGKDGEDFAEQALLTLAYHRNARADEVLEELASAPFPLDRREKAIFWIGQLRGERGVRFLTKVVTSDPSGDVREKAIFSLSQSDSPSAIRAIIQASREDKSAKVRGEALFWLAQTGDAQAPDRILQAIDSDPDREVKKKGVFALSQLPESQGVPLLARVGRESRDKEIRKEAFFWLAQSDDPAALKLLDKALND